MSSGQKTTFSILISVVLFGVFSVFAFTGLFSAIDMRFYEPAKISQINKRLEKISKFYDEYIETLNARFATGESAYLKNPSIATYVEGRPNEDDVKKREELTGTLRSETQGLLGIRVIEGSAIHYSTFSRDIFREVPAQNIRTFKHYNEILAPSGKPEVPVEKITAKNADGNIIEGSRVYFDGSEGRIIFSYPLYNKFLTFCGTVVFYMDADSFTRSLLKQKLIGVAEAVDFVASNDAHGFVFGIPSIVREEFLEPILKTWKENQTSAQKLFAITSSDETGTNSETYWVIISSRGEDGGFVSEIFKDEILRLPFFARALILICSYFSIFLIVFLIFNLRRDDMTVIRERIRTLQLGVVDEYLKRKMDLDWQSVSGRREAVTKEIIASLGRRAKRHPKEVQELIDRSWEELLAAMGFQSKLQQQQSGGGFSPEGAEEIKAMLQEILSSGNIKVQAVAAPQSAQTVKAAPAAVSQKTHALDEAEELDDSDVEEIEEVEDVEDLEEVEEVDDVEDLEEVADADEVEELDEIDEAEVFEDLEDTEEVSDAESVGEVEETENIDAESFGISSKPEKPKPVHSPKEIFDISEDVNLDFFAVKKDASAVQEKKTDTDKKGLLSRATSIRVENEKDSEILTLDRFKHIRGVHNLDEDDLDKLDNFAVRHVDYTNLDAHSDEQKVNGTYESERKEINKELSPQDFGMTMPADTEEFEEELNFSSPPQAPKKGEDNGIADNFKTEIPQFESTAEKKTFEKPKNIFEDKGVALKNTLNKEKADTSIDEAVPLSNMEEFVFSGFGKNDDKVADLQSAENTAIFQDSDGVFSISRNLKTNNVIQDSSFKLLVDSVLNN